jgi:hypothetical protein
MQMRSISVLVLDIVPTLQIEEQLLPKYLHKCISERTPLRWRT